MKTDYKKYIVSILILLSILSCGKEKFEESTTEDTNQSSKVEFTDEQFKVGEIELGKISKKDLSDVVSVSGIIDVPPQNLISISAPMGGFIKSTKLLPGNVIKKGDVLAVIENAEFITLQQDYLESKTKLEYMQQELDRQKILSKENVTSTKIMQQTEADYKFLKVRIKALEEKLALIGIVANQLNENNMSRSIPIRSSINGYVKSVNINTGKYVNPTDVLFEIENTSDIHLQLDVFEKSASRLMVGQKIKFTLPNEEKKERTATIYLIGKSINEDKTVNVHAHINEQDKNILPGMFVKAKIEVNNNEVPCLPDAAIVQSDGKSYVFVLENKGNDKQTKYLFNMVEVKTGVSEGGYTEVILPDTIDANSITVALKGAYTILSKMKNSEE